MILCRSGDHAALKVYPRTGDIRDVSPLASSLFTVISVAAAALEGPASIDRALDGEPPPQAGGGQKYVGVAPGPEARNPLPPASKAPPHLIWSGFQVNEQGSRVFFQTNLPVTFEVKPGDGERGGRTSTLSVFLRNCRIHLKNNRRNLDTRFFATPVSGVTAHQRRKDVELRIAFKEPTAATPRTEPGPDGTQFLVLDFAAGPGAAAAGTPAAPATDVVPPPADGARGGTGAASLEPPSQTPGKK